MKQFFIFFLIVYCISCAPKVKPPEQIGAWIVYWDAERGLQELEKYGSIFDRVSLFAYELDYEGNILYAPGFKEVMPRFFELAEKKGFSPWVTVVNDIRDINKVNLKDAATIRKILNNPILFKKHLHNLIRQIKNDGFLGLDLDYESLESYDNDIFNQFIKELSEELQKEGLGLNVILEPNYKFSLQKGLTKVTVMAYNLHGPNTQPGPRSTPHFINKLYKRGTLDKDFTPSLALAVGGFLWSSDKKANQIDWINAKKLAMSATKKGKDIKSSVPFAILENGYEIWYEDEESIEKKWIAAYRAGYRNLMIWRLGGNDDNLFNLLFKYKNIKNK